jgi:glycosyltransferase involved in cell wall biosynthesis
MISKKKKLLIIATRHIGDKTSGADTRLLRQIENVADVFDIYIYHRALSSMRVMPKLYLELSILPFIKKVYTFNINDSSFAKLLAKISLKPYFPGKKEWLINLEQVVNEVNPDIIQCDLFLSSYYLPKTYSDISIAYGQDSLSRFAKSGLINAKSIFSKIKFFNKLWQYRLHEKCYEKFKKSVFVSNEDIKHLKNGNYEVVNLSVNEQNLDSFPKNNKLLFFGNLSYAPNEDSILWFIDSVLPKIKLRNSKIKLVIAGSNATEKIKNASMNDSIYLIDTPQDMFEIIRQSNMVILPILWGSGQKNKVLEAMAACRPVICSSHAIEGTLIEHDKHVMVADTNDDYVNYIVDLLKDDIKVKELVKNSKLFITNNFSNAILRKKYLAILNSI